jgi:hypothetical protein
MKTYSYAGVRVLFAQVGGVGACIFATLMAAAICLGPILLRRDASFVVNISCFGIWFLVVGWLVGLTMINAYPTVSVGDEHLVISAFLFARVSIPWVEVLDVGAGHVPFGHTLVRARRITLLHRVYGWMYSRTLYPSFLVGRDITGREELLQEIRTRTREARPSGPPQHQTGG